MKRIFCPSCDSVLKDNGKKICVVCGSRINERNDKNKKMEIRQKRKFKQDSQVSS
jgi:hypothetical protein